MWYKFKLWLTSFSLGMLFFWWVIIAVSCGGSALLWVTDAQAADRVHYINYDTDTGEDYLTTTDEEWIFFKDIGGIHVPWTFVDLQRDLLMFRQDIEFEGTSSPICFVFEVEVGGVEMARYIKDIDKLNITNSRVLHCSGFEEWVKKELQ
jgi:hypothetical protein